MLLDHAAVGLCRRRLQAHRDHLVEIHRRQVRHRRPVRQLHRHRLRHRLLAGLDPGDNQCRTAARLFRRDHAVTPDRHPLPVLAARAGLHHVDLAPRRIDANPEAQQFAVPEHRVPVSLERLHGAPRDRRALQFRHALSSCRALALGRFGFIVLRFEGQEIVPDAGPDLRRRRLLSVPREVRIPHGRHHRLVPEQPGDQRQPLAE